MPERTRKEQIEQDFLRRLRRQFKSIGIELDDVGMAYARDALKSAAFAGAVAERDRTLGLLRGRRGVESLALYADITARGVLDVLGYES